MNILPAYANPSEYFKQIFNFIRWEVKNFSTI